MTLRRFLDIVVESISRSFLDGVAAILAMVDRVTVYILVRLLCTMPHRIRIILSSL